MVVVALLVSGYYLLKNDNSPKEQEQVKATSVVVEKSNDLEGDKGLRRNKRTVKRIIKAKESKSADSLAKVEKEDALSPEERKAQQLEKFAEAAMLKTIASNMDRQMEQTFAGVLAMDLSDKQREALLRVKEQFNGDKYLETLKNDINNNLDENELSQLNELYQQQDFKDILERKLKLQTPEGQAELMASVRNFDPNSLDKDRLAALKDHQKDSAEKKVVLKSMSTLFRSAMNLSNKDEAKMSEAQLAQMDRMVAEGIKRHELPMKNQMFKGMSTEQIRQNNKQLNSPAHRKLTGIVASRAGKMSNQIAQIFNEVANQ